MNAWPNEWTRQDRRPPLRDPQLERTRVLPDADFRHAGAPPRRPSGYGTPPRRAPRPMPPPPRSGGWRRKLLAVLAVLALLLVVLYFYADSRLNKVNALEDYEGRPSATPGQDWLLVGSDSREGMTAEDRKRLHTGQASGRRTDSIMIMHISQSGGRATLVSLPRDSYVDIPAYTDEGGGEHSAQKNKLNAAFSFGGPQLLARTVEQETGIRLDRYMEIGFGGFADVVDAVGGVEICVDKAIKDQKAGADLKKGCQELDGEQALAFVRARYFDPTGDLGRVERQRKFLRSLSKEVSSPATLLNPFAMTKIMNSGLGALIVDEDTGPISLLWFAWQMKRLSGGDGITMTVPVAGTGMAPGAGSVVNWDREKALALFDALQADEPVPASLVPKKDKDQAK